MPRSLVLLVGRIPSWAQKEGPHTRNAAKDLEVMVATQFRFVLLEVREARPANRQNDSPNEMSLLHGTAGSGRCVCDDIDGGAVLLDNYGEINSIGQCVIKR